MQKNYSKFLLLTCRLSLLLLFIPCASKLVAQSTKDSTVLFENNYITLSEVVIDSRLNVPSFITRVKSDTSFYKAFKNLRILGYTSINDIRMFDKKENQTASLRSKTQQKRENGCRFMHTLEEQVSGDMYTGDREWNYYTAQLYASLFFTDGRVCGETNIIGNTGFSTSGKSGLDKHKEQLKMLFFNPGKRISGMPFMSDKTEIFDKDISDCYEMSVDMDFYNKTGCYVFRQKVKPGRESDVVIDEMTTWFDDKTFEVVARNYSLSYDAGVYEFKVGMDVEMTSFNGLTVPSLIRYNGNWKVLFKKREHGVFTATLFDFNSN